MGVRSTFLECRADQDEIMNEVVDLLTQREESCVNQLYSPSAGNRQDSML